MAAAAGMNDGCVDAFVGTLDAYIVKADGSGQRALADEFLKERIPTWSPSGHQRNTADTSEWV